MRVNWARTFFTDRKSGAGRCAEVTVIRGSTVLFNKKLIVLHRGD